MKIIRQKRKTLKRERIFPLLARSWLCMFGVIDFHDRALEYLALFCPKKSIASHNNTEIVTALGLTFLYPARIGIIFKLNSLILGHLLRETKGMGSLFITPCIVSCKRLTYKDFTTHGESSAESTLET